ncbi:MAG: hypothetical protein PHU03_04180, partial [Syntrophales bacterium]|nr:hypothetical protein [Syntrophales bacterium]
HCQDCLIFHKESLINRGKNNIMDLPSSKCPEIKRFGDALTAAEVAQSLPARPVNLPEYGVS